jgi:hypothetical protein
MRARESLSFAADMRPPSHIFEQVARGAASQLSRLLGFLAVITSSEIRPDGLFSGAVDIAARTAIYYRHDEERRFIARSGNSPCRRKRKFLCFIFSPIEDYSQSGLDHDSFS